MLDERFITWARSHGHPWSYEERSHEWTWSHDVQSHGHTCSQEITAAASTAELLQINSGFVP